MWAEVEPKTFDCDGQVARSLMRTFCLYACHIEGAYTRNQQKLGSRRAHQILIFWSQVAERMQCSTQTITNLVRKTMKSIPLVAEEGALEVLFEDRLILAVNKPAGETEPPTKIDRLWCFCT